MDPDLKAFYQATIDYHNSRRVLLDTNPTHGDLIDTFAELAIDLYHNSDGPAAQAIAEQMNKIESTLSSNKVPF